MHITSMDVQIKPRLDWLSGNFKKIDITIFVTLQRTLPHVQKRHFQLLCQLYVIGSGIFKEVI